MSSTRSIRSVGLLGVGAFGRLVAKHLSPIVPVIAYDPALKISDVAEIDVQVGTVAEVGSCDMLVIAAPVSEFGTALRQVRPYLRPGAAVVDVGSVKVGPIKIMQDELPDFVEIVGTHPLFGPQSAWTGIAGRKIVVCPVRGRRTARTLIHCAAPRSEIGRHRYDARAA
jgi:prephenate dehydrogenase